MSLCHMLIQKKSIIISSVTETLHINVIQCQLTLIKHLSLFLRMTILIYSILNPVFWLATWAGVMGLPSFARDSRIDPTQENLQSS